MGFHVYPFIRLRDIFDVFSRVLEDNIQKTEQRKEQIERDVPSEKQLQSLFN